MSRPRSKHAPVESAHRDAEIPVVLPHVVMEVAADGTMTVAIDGSPYPPAPFAPPWRREDFAAILDQLTDQRRSPLRVEVRETDGGVFTDIVTPGKRRRPEPEVVPEATGPAVADLMLLRGGGFVPGEDVTVAVVIAHSEAARDGTSHGALTPDQLAASPTREVILLGRVSGAVAVGHLE